ncbi:hypothetical protein FW774_09315 [Pedobacter sp. BS3]|uniref:hypothetical protein n=1 Tax=Pedobacter sp. BS3 TaxID=2567937 RepID=UPI0011EDEE05|nr:hypothetical protein [Pedobacter sp. BS3]TZF83663.1 hypothetical protein FW774_09315 [Pedobacter sp. BS3]
MVYNSDNSSFWIANNDGTDKQKLNIPLPSGHTWSYVEHFAISPDGKKIFIGFADAPNAIYSCNIDGSDMKKIVDDAVNFVLY